MFFMVLRADGTSAQFVRLLLNIVASQFLTEARGGAVLVLGLVEHRNSGIECGGNFRYTEKGIKDCTNCQFPHKRENYDKVTGRFQEIVELIRE